MHCTVSHFHIYHVTTVSSFDLADGGLGKRKLENRVALIRKRAFKKLYPFSRRADAAAPGRQNIQYSDIKTESFDNECKQSVRTSHVGLCMEYFADFLNILRIVITYLQQEIITF